MVDVVVADAAGGRDAQVVYYCCPRRRREDASWRGECIERHQQFVCLSRVRQRMYIFLEDFTNTTRVNPRSSKFFSEAVSYGAIRCDCQNGCDRCGRFDKQIVLLRLAHRCRKRVREGSYINTKTYADSSSVWPGPYSRWENHARRMFRRCMKTPGLRTRRLNGGTSDCHPAVYPTVDRIDPARMLSGFRQNS